MPGQYFACLGAQKCGTTWLYRFLKNKTSAIMPELKEFHWFDERTGKVQGFHQWYQWRWETRSCALKASGEHFTREDEQLRARSLMSSDDDYKAFFQSYCGVNSGSVSGDITPSYAMLDAEHFGAIKSLFFNAKLIQLLRNPVDRHWSATHHLANKLAALQPGQREAASQPVALNYADYAHLPPLNAEDLALAMLQDPRFRRRSDYHRSYTAARSVFSSTEIKTVFSEHLFSADVVSVCERVSEFLNVEINSAPSLLIKKPAYPAMSRELRKRFFQALKADYQWAQSKFRQIPDTWLRDLRDFS
ncbi:Sulfotransferase family protein [Allochromatium warmingii]|uniref:Sulfotransferase family protein n=1 Tax=Allochromatium warmingii TaxID=61595 RepID=A0A1H3JVC8_ALLWA|nr:sulfotransferase [Allochromatium warmingii]SDY43465.1 Sulfotransferase family protein [Allochromatium warmingii]